MSLKELLRKHTPGLFAKLHTLNLVRLYATETNPLVYNCRQYTSSDKVRNFIKILATPFNILGYLFRRDIPASEREGLAFVLIAKNEAPYIEEWINFHVKQGVTHFIIYDNESTDNFREVLEPYIKSGLVTYKILKGRRRQNDAYNMAVHDYKHKFRYMAFIDADEFMFVRNNTGGRGGGSFPSLMIS